MPPPLTGAPTNEAPVRARRTAKCQPLSQVPFSDCTVHRPQSSRHYPQYFESKVRRLTH
jgi:hypothetical protein